MIVESEPYDVELELIIQGMYEIQINEQKTGELGKEELMLVQKIYKNVLMHIWMQKLSTMENDLMIFQLQKN
jgi:hypothetical protein